MTRGRDSYVLHLANRYAAMATAPTKGYDCEFISEVPSHCKCPICECVLRDPQRVSCCDEEYCKECILQVLSDDKPCPGCGNNNDISISESKKTKRLALQLRCRCTNQKEGCEWKGELQELDAHLNKNPTTENQLNGCDFTTVHCRWCQETFPRNQLGEHQENVCQRRPFNCQYCGHHDTYEQVINIHLPECPQQPVECPQGCGLSPQRQNLTVHKADECPNTTLKCGIQGCEERRQRKDMTEHNNEYSAQHVQLLSQKVRQLEKEQQQSKEEAEQRKREQDARQLPITLTMKNYEQLLTGRDQWMSQLLYTHERGYAIFLSVYTSGYGLASIMGDISVYIYATRGEYDEELQWPYRLSIEVSLLSNEENGDNVTKTCTIQAIKAAQSRYGGWTRFIKERIAQQHYVKDNCLKFRVSNITEHDD